MQITFIPSLKDVVPNEWNALWGSDYPFVRHEFLFALETSGCTSTRTGWSPSHAIATAGDELVGALPLYVKTHSYGEYVFDWSWANAYQQAGFDYYPKLLNAIPFTPATGPRLAIKPELSAEDRQEVVSQLLQAIRKRVSAKVFSGLHCLFTAKENALEFAAYGWLLQRLDCQFHWINQGYVDFPGFLQSFSSRKRKNVNKERARIPEQGFKIQMTEGTHLAPEDWHHFYRLYRRTYLKRSGHDGYLNEAFFRQIGATMADQIVMAQARRGDDWCAAALYFKDASTLYGRYWGATDEYDALHFECCYYQGIEYAIANQLQRFDPGAQGEHKIARGFTPVLTQSFHYLQQPEFAAAVQRFLRDEQAHVRAYCMDARLQLPFKEDHPLVPADCLLAMPKELSDLEL